MAPSRLPAASVSSSSARVRSASSCLELRSRARARAASSPLAAGLGVRAPLVEPARDRASRPPPAGGDLARASFSARSAAVACSASGRRRLRTSVLEIAGPLDLGRDAGELQLGAMAAQLEASEARPPPRPARAARPASAPSTASTLPCEITERSPPPSPTSESSSTRSSRRTAARLTRYWPSPPRWSRRAIETSENGEVGPGAVLVVEDAARPRRSRPALRPAEPAKRTSSGFSARSSCGLSEPVAQRIASEMFDLPGAVRPDDDRDPRLEAHLDRVDERLEAAQLDRLQVHAAQVCRAGGWRRRRARLAPSGCAGQSLGVAARQVRRPRARAPRAPPPARPPSSSRPRPTPACSPSTSAAR